MKAPTPAQQLTVFLARFSPEVAALARTARAKLRKRLPRAIEMVYDNYNALVIGFGPSEKTSEAAFSIALYPRWVTLFFLQGVALKDPERVLVGAGKQVRRIVIEGPETLDQPAVRALIAQAWKRAGAPPAAIRRCVVIKSISAKQRPRRP